MADAVNAFTVYSSLELQINEFIQQLNRASQILDSTLQNMSGAVMSLDIQPIEVNTEIVPPDISTYEIPSEILDPDRPDMPVATPFSVPSEIENPDMPSMPEEQTYTLHTETEPLDPVTVPPPDDRSFVQKIKDSFNNLKNTVSSIPTDIALKFTEMEIKIRNTVTSIPSNIVGKFKEMGTNIVNTVKSFPSNVATKFSEMKTLAVEKIKELPSNIAGVITSIPSKIGSGLKTIGTNISNAFKSGVENAKNSLKELPAKATEALKETGEKLKSIAETIAKSATVAISAVSAGVVAFGKSAIDTGKNFDKSMSQVAATMGKSVDEVSDLRAFAQEMGRTTAFSATDSADALNYMALAGYDAETSMAMLPNVLNLASAGGMELALASDMITDSQSALGLSLDETTQLVDKMAKASSKSNTSVSQLGDAILTVGGTAKKLKGGTTELATVLGILADNGIKGSEGGTALRNIMNSLISPTDDAIAMLDQMGTALYDSEGNMRSLNDVFIDLRNGMSGLATQEERDQVLTTIFNSRDLKSAEALIANVGDRFNELSTEIDNCSGAADAMAKTQLDNLAGDVTLFQSALEGAKIAVSDHLTPALRDFVNIGSGAMNAIAIAFKASDLETALSRVERLLQPYINKLINKVFDAIPKVVSVAVKLISVLGQSIIKNITKLANSAVQLLKGFAEGITKNAPTAIKGFSDMLKKVANWIKQNGKTLISSGMAMIKSIAKGISDNLPDMIDSIKEIVTFIATEISENLDDVLDSGLDILKALGQGLIDNLPELVGTALDIVTSLGEYLIDKIPVLKDKAPEIVEALATALGECGEKMVTAADTLISKFADAVGLGKKWEEIKTSIKGAVDNILTSFNNIKEVLQPLKDAFDKLKDKIFGTENDSGLLKKTLDLLCDIISETISVIGEIISSLMDFVTWLNSGSKEAETLKNVIESIVMAMGLMLGGMAIKGLIAKLPILLGNIVSLTATLVANAAAWIATAAPIIALGAAIALVIYDIKMIIDNLDELKEFFPLVFNDVKKFFTKMGDTIGGAVYDIVQKIKNIPKEILKIVDNAWQWGSDMVQNFIGGLKEKAEDLWDSVKGIAQGVKNFLGFSEPDKGPLSNFHTFAPDMIALFTQGIKDNKKSIFSEINDIATSIKDTFSEPISVNAGVHAKGIFSSLDIPDISTVAENIYTVKSDNAQSYQAEKESPVTVENLNIYVEGMKFETERELEKFTEMLANRLNALKTRKLMGTGGVIF